MTPDPLAEPRARAGTAIRQLGHAFVGRHATGEQLGRLAATLEALVTDLRLGQPRRRVHPTGGRAPIEVPQGRFPPNYDDRPISGRSSPWGLDLELHRHGDEIEAIVTLDSAHEGAPGRSHGGIVAALFDDVFGYVLGVIQQPAFTGELTVRYLAPTPLHRPLACRVWLAERSGRKLTLRGELRDVHDATEVVATAHATFIAVDPEYFAQLTAERPAPPDEDARPE